HRRRPRPPRRPVPAEPLPPGGAHPLAREGPGARIVRRPPGARGVGGRPRHDRAPLVGVGRRRRAADARGGGARRHRSGRTPDGAPLRSTGLAVPGWRAYRIEPIEPGRMGGAHPAIVLPVVPQVGVPMATEDETPEEDENEDGPKRPVPASLPALRAPPRGMRSKDLLSFYLSEVRRYPLLDPEEEKQLAIRFAEHGDPEAAERLVTANLRLVIKIAFQYHRQWANVLDLIQEGNVGLV